MAKLIKGDSTVSIEVYSLKDLSDLVLTDLRIHLNHAFEELALSDIASLILVEGPKGISQGKILVH